MYLCFAKNEIPVARYEQHVTRVFGTHTHTRTQFALICIPVGLSPDKLNLPIDQLYTSSHSCMSQVNVALHIRFRCRSCTTHNQLTTCTTHFSPTFCVAAYTRIQYHLLRPRFSYSFIPYGPKQPERSDQRAHKAHKCFQNDSHGIEQCRLNKKNKIEYVPNVSMSIQSGFWLCA